MFFWVAIDASQSVITTDYVWLSVPTSIYFIKSLKLIDGHYESWVLTLGTTADPCTNHLKMNKWIIIVTVISGVVKSWSKIQAVATEFVLSLCT